MLWMVLAIAAPWLSPLTWGPQPEMLQRLLSGACGAVLLVGWVGGYRGDGEGGGHLPARALADALAIGWLLAALLSAAAGLLQYFGLEERYAWIWVSSSSPGQAYANLRQRNQFASLTALGLVALLYLLAEHGQHRTEALRRARPMQAVALRGLAVLALAVLACGNAASSSRTGVLQWLGLVLLVWLWERRSMRGWTLLAAGLYGLAAWALPLALQMQTGQVATAAWQRFQESAGCGSRRILWRNVLELIAQRPWGGWGWDGLKFAHFITPYQGERFCELLDNAHNLPLHLAVALGLPAALLLCGGALAAVLWARPWRATDPARQMAWAALATIALHSLLEYPLWYGPFQLATLLSLWLLWRTRRTQCTPGTPRAPRHAAARPGLYLAGAAALLAAAAYTGWDYWRVGQLYLPPSLRAPSYRNDTLAKVQDSWLFRDMVRFARVTTTAANSDNAAALYADALQTLHYSPEPKVIAALLESARLLGREDATTAHIRRQWLINYGQEPMDIP